MTGLMNLVPGVGQAKMIGIALAAAATFGTGFAAAEIYENYAPWGLGPKLERLRNSLPKRDAERYSAGAREQHAKDVRVVEEEWRPALTACESKRLTGSASAAQRMDQEITASRQTSSAAYRLGLASCKGKNNASSASSATRPTDVLSDSDTDLGSIVRSSASTDQ